MSMSTYTSTYMSTYLSPCMSAYVSTYESVQQEVTSSGADMIEHNKGLQRQVQGYLR